MKNQARNLAVLTAAIVAFTVAGCTITKKDTTAKPPAEKTAISDVAVTEAPPAPRQEMVSTPPNINSVWQSGHWVRRNNQWTWQNGRWMMRPSAHAYWEPGHWDETRNGWVWTDGQWHNNYIP